MTSSLYEGGKRHKDRSIDLDGIDGWIDHSCLYTPSPIRLCVRLTVSCALSTCFHDGPICSRFMESEGGGRVWAVLSVVNFAHML